MAVMTDMALAQGTGFLDLAAHRGLRHGLLGEGQLSWWTNAPMAWRTSTSCPRNQWPPLWMVTSLAPGMRSAAWAAKRYGARVSSLALMTSVGTVSCSRGNRSAARLETKPSKTAPSRLGLRGTAGSGPR